MIESSEGRYERLELAILRSFFIQSFP